VNCDQVRDHLLEGRVAETPEVQQHAAECSACHELVATRGLVEALRAGAPSANGAGQLGQLQAQVRAELSRETSGPARLRSMRTRTRLLLALALIVAIGVVEGTLLARADMPFVPTEHLLPMLGILGLLAVAAAWVALRPLFRPALPRSFELVVLLLCLSVPAALSFVQPDTGHHPSVDGFGADFFHHAGACLVHGLTLAVLVWLAFRALDRQALGSGLGALVGGMAGAVVATLGLQLHCAIPAAPHWLFGHAGVGAIVLVGLWIRQRL